MKMSEFDLEICLNLHNYIQTYYEENLSITKALEV